MSDHIICTIYPSDKKGNGQVSRLLFSEGIRRDRNLDYTCAIFDNSGDIIATGSCFKNTLRCLAVAESQQGKGLMNEIISHLMYIQFSRGNSHVFLYTKCTSSRYFKSLGFHEIARIEDHIVFMENRKNGFSDYLKNLRYKQTVTPNAAALVINANPFTLGHQFLVEKAASENETVHLFIVSEDTSLIPFSVRKKLILDGTAHLPNICFHETGPYMISNATFPSYFQKDDQAVIESHALLDVTIFSEIAKVLNIRKRYVGEEPTSMVTSIYNKIMKQKLPEYGIECIIVPRKQVRGTPVSASAVRQAIKDGNTALLSEQLPPSSLRYFCSSEARDVIGHIQRAPDVTHY